MKNKNQLIRSQLNHSLTAFKSASLAHRPVKGWIKALRNAVGMSARQLGERMGISQQRLTAIESKESTDSLTIHTLKKVAEATNTHFIYGFAPKTDLDTIVKQQAEIYLKKYLNRVKHSMSLEGQSLTESEWQNWLENEIRDLIATNPSKIWDVKE